MRSIKILKHGMYLPKKVIDNKSLALKYNITEQYIEQRTGIYKRYKIEKEKIEELAINAVKNLLGEEINPQEIDLIVVATSSTNKIMPGISYLIQKEFDIQECMCIDILAGCSGYINAFDIARNYIINGKIEKALIVGVEILTDKIKEMDLSTEILFSDGAGATLIQNCTQNKKYDSLIQSCGQQGDFLTYFSGDNLYMDGKEIYKYAVTKTVDNIKELLKRNHIQIEEIKYIVPHQSNQKIMKAIANRLKLPEEKMYSNIQQIGNTFCASIPIALEQMTRENLLKPGDKIILLGYGGGLNLGSILIEI